MALDFPASPTDGQLYAGANGVVYQWSASKGLWLAMPSMVTPSGDFYAYTASASGITTTPSVVVFSTVYSGNVGSYYNPANGRFTPPAGRYRLTTGVNWFSSSSSIGAHIAFRKNGVQINNAINNASQGSNYYALSIVEMTFDANGTDYFEVQAASSGPTPSGVSWMWFSAQPLGVVVAMNNGFRLLSRQVLSAAAADMKVQNIPSDINDLMFHFDMTPANNAVDLVLQFYDGAGALLSTAGTYTWANSANYHTVPTANPPSGVGSATAGITNGFCLNYPVATRKVGNLSGIRGKGSVPNIRASRITGVDYQSNWASDDGTLQLAATGDGYQTAAGAISGLRFVFGAGNVAAGSALSVWGSP